MELEELVKRKNKKKGASPRNICTKNLQTHLQLSNRQKLVFDISNLQMKMPSKKHHQQNYQSFTSKSNATTSTPKKKQGYELFDAWAADTPQQQQQQKKIKSVILPKTGQSYNPSVEAYNELVKEVVEHETEKSCVRKIKSQPILKKISKAKNKKRREEQLKILQRHAEVERQKEVKLLPNALRQIENRIKKLTNRKKALQRQRLERAKKQSESGIVEKGPKIGTQRYEWKGHDILGIEEMPGNMLSLPNRNEAILERMDSLNRQGLSQKIGIPKSKKRSFNKKYKLIRKNKRVE